MCLCHLCWGSWWNSALLVWSGPVPVVAAILRCEPVDRSFLSSTVSHFLLTPLCFSNKQIKISWKKKKTGKRRWKEGIFQGPTESWGGSVDGDWWISCTLGPEVLQGPDRWWRNSDSRISSQGKLLPWLQPTESQVLEKKNHHLSELERKGISCVHSWISHYLPKIKSTQVQVTWNKQTKTLKPWEWTFSPAVNALNTPHQSVEAWFPTLAPDSSFLKYKT